MSEKVSSIAEARRRKEIKEEELHIPFTESDRENWELTARVGHLTKMLKDAKNRMAKKTRQHTEEMRARDATIASLQAQLEQSKIIGFTDALTGLYNRRYFDDRLGEIVSTATRKKKKFCLVLADIDYFKRINDTYGHGVGDTVLKLLGSILWKNSRPSDLACRSGGEEFSIIFTESDLNEVRRSLRRLRRILQRELVITVGSEVIRPTLSFGIAVLENGDTPEILYSRADTGLYAAKGAGRNCVRKA